jgi:hypothetical protein
LYPCFLSIARAKTPAPAALTRARTNSRPPARGGGRLRRKAWAQTGRAGAMIKAPGPSLQGGRNATTCSALNSTRFLFPSVRLGPLAHGARGGTELSGRALASVIQRQSAMPPPAAHGPAQRS